MRQVPDGRWSTGSALARRIGSAVLPAVLTAATYYSLGPAWGTLAAYKAASTFVERAPTAWRAVSEISLRTAGAARSGLRKITRCLAEAFGDGETRHCVLDENDRKSDSDETKETKNTDPDEETDAEKAIEGATCAGGSITVS